MKLRTLLITLPILVVLVALAVANRSPVVLSLDPFGGATPGYAVTMPLFLALFAALLLGILIGGGVAWASGWQRRRVLTRRYKVLQREVESTRPQPSGPLAHGGASLPAPVRGGTPAGPGVP